MSTGSISHAQRLPAAGAELPAQVCWMIVVFLSLAGDWLGGMAFLMMALAAGLAALVWQRPQEAPGAGMLFLFAAMVLLPYSARLDLLAPSASEMYYWAAGLLVITVTAVLRVGVRQVFNVPASAKAFFAVASASSAMALAQGAPPSYVLRQFYGVFLLIVYFGLALNVGSESLLLRRVATFGTLSALMFFVYFLKMFAGYGFHREMTTVGTAASMLATALFFAGWQQKKRSYLWGALLLLAVPALIIQRGAMLTFLVALPLAAAIQAPTKKLRLFSCLVFLLVALPGFVPGVADQVGEFAATIPVLGPVLPAGAGDSGTLLDRGLQLLAATDTVQAHPWLGTGLGSDIEFISTTGYRDVPYVENGWAYLLQKMGLAGAATFLWFLWTILRHLSRKSLGLSACLLAVVLVTMFNEAAFFHFTTAPFVGTFSGLLVGKNGPHLAWPVPERLGIRGGQSTPNLA